MTIFDILHITPPDYPVTFHNGQFYAYKDILIDLHNEKQIKLKPLTQNNTLYQQLNIDPKTLPSAMYYQGTIDQLIHRMITYSFITYLKIEFTDITVKYFHTLHNQIITFNVSHEQNDKEINHYEYCDISQNIPID